MRGRKILSPSFAREGLCGNTVQLSIRSPLAPLKKGGKDAGSQRCSPLPASGRGLFRDGYADTPTVRQGDRAYELRNCGQGISPV